MRVDGVRVDGVRVDGKGVEGRGWRVEVVGRNEGLEGWKVGRLEGWRSGGLEGRRVGGWKCMVRQYYICERSALII